MGTFHSRIFLFVLGNLAMYEISAFRLHSPHRSLGKALLLKRLLLIQRNNHIFPLARFLVKDSLQGIFPLLWKFSSSLFDLLCGFLRLFLFLF